ncbi:MAG: hypothetical protein ACREVV_00430 [Steroidobacteraceae bacterium]
MSSGRSANSESDALASWYGAHSNVRHLCAIKDSLGLRVLVTIEPTHDGNDSDPAWIANRDAGAQELQLCTAHSVRLERLDEPMFDSAAIDSEGLIVGTLSWRDPSFT